MRRRGRKVREEWASVAAEGAGIDCLQPKLYHILGDLGQVRELL